MKCICFAQLLNPQNNIQEKEFDIPKSILSHVCILQLQDHPKKQNFMNNKEIYKIPLNENETNFLKKKWN